MKCIAASRSLDVDIVLQPETKSLRDEHGTIRNAYSSLIEANTCHTQHNAHWKLLSNHDELR